MKKYMNFKKPMSLAAVLALCLCVTVTAAATDGFGLFRDVTNVGGAVIGAEYLHATNEIQVDAVVMQDELAITATLLNPDAAPYSAQEVLRIGAYQIVDLDGNVIAEGECMDSFTITDGKVTMYISLSGLENGSYKLLVNAFIGDKKADQPLPIRGSWECEFTV